MAEARTIRSGIGTYLNTDGQWTHGVLGDEVEVHEDDLERFDRLNPAEPEADAEAEDVAPTFSQEDVDAAVKTATEALTAELEQAKKDVAAATAERDAAKAELDKSKAPAQKTPAAKS